MPPKRTRPDVPTGASTGVSRSTKKRVQSSMKAFLVPSTQASTHDETVSDILFQTDTITPPSSLPPATNGSDNKTSMRSIHSTTTDPQPPVIRPSAPLQSSKASSRTRSKAPSPILVACLPEIEAFIISVENGIGTRDPYTVELIGLLSPSEPLVRSNSALCGKEHLRDTLLAWPSWKKHCFSGEVLGTWADLTVSDPADNQAIAIACHSLISSLKGSPEQRDDIDPEKELAWRLLNSMITTEILLRRLDLNLDYGPARGLSRRTRIVRSSLDISIPWLRSITANRVLCLLNLSVHDQRCGI